MEAVKPLCDSCVRSGVFDSIMVSYQTPDEVFDTQLGVPYHCASGAHERAYHAYDGYTSPFEGTPTKATANLCRVLRRPQRKVRLVHLRYLIALRGDLALSVLQ
jgi:hypothetical protein